MLGGVLRVGFKYRDGLFLFCFVLLMTGILLCHCYHCYTALSESHLRLAGGRLCWVFIFLFMIMSGYTKCLPFFSFWTGLFGLSLDCWGVGLGSVSHLV